MSPSERQARELDETREQKAANCEVLRVISSAPSNLKPVFAPILENAVRISAANFGVISRWDASTLHLIAAHNTPPGLAEFRQRHPSVTTQTGHSSRRFRATLSDRSHK
jgi:hypothetical protein